MSWQRVSGSLIATALAATGPAMAAAAAAPLAPTAAAVKRPNVVFILTDDLSWNLVNKKFAPHIMKLERQGETFSNYFVADSLCCPSRATIFTGLFPHDTKVVRNIPPDGGFQKFQSEHLDQRTFAVALQSAGYTTSMLGKYLNGYGDPMNKTTAPVPPGWSDWHVGNGTGYAEFNYLLNDNGTYHRYLGPTKYGVDVLNTKAQSFITRAAGKPFAIEVATFAPHAPYTPAPRNAGDFPGLKEPRDPSFDTSNANPPSWLDQRSALGHKRILKIDTAYRKRAQAVEAVDKLLADTEATLAARHLTDQTYIVFSSDNGYHLGQHRLHGGKQTAFDTDIRVPLIVAGPGVPRNRVISQVAQNVDLAPTFTQLAGARPAAPVEGHSLVPLLQRPRGARHWRTVALVEHQHSDNASDPDFEGGGSNPTSYDAIRIAAKHLHGFKGAVNAVYVEYQDPKHETEYYDIAKDPFERRNIAKQLTHAQRTELHQIVTRLERCHRASTCWAAASPS